MRVEKGSEVSKLSSKELRRDLLVFARNNPKLFLELADDENVMLRNFGIRAVEEGRHVIRVANTGISSSIDPFGRILKKINLNTEGSFDTKLICVKKNYDLIETIYSKFGNKLIFFILLILFCFASFLRFKIKK